MPTTQDRQSSRPSDTRGGADRRLGRSGILRPLGRGELRGSHLVPYPALPPSEEARVEHLLAGLGECSRELIDPRSLESRGEVGDELFGELAARGLMGASIGADHGGQGLSEAAFVRVAEGVGYTDPALGIVWGIHNSIGVKGMVAYANDEQRDRFFGDLAAARRLAGFALTEKQAGSDAWNVQSRAVRQADGSWRLNGEKRFVGNGSIGSVFIVIARAEVDGRDGHVALIVEKGTEGFEVEERWDMMGIRANDVCRLSFRDVRVPAENLLGEAGQGFEIAMHVLTLGRLALAGIALGAAKRTSELILEHVSERRQFGRRLAEFELVERRVASATAEIAALEVATFLTACLADTGEVDYLLESAMCKVMATDFAFWLANEALQLKGGEGYMRSQPYEKLFRDVRSYIIFEGGNDMLRCFVGSSVLKHAAIRSKIVSRARDQADGERTTEPLAVHESHRAAADAVADQCELLGRTVERILAEHGRGFLERQHKQCLVADAVGSVYAQAALLSRSSQLAEKAGGADPPELKVLGAARGLQWERARTALHSVLDDGELGAASAELAALAYSRGTHGYAFERGPDKREAG